MGWRAGGQPCSVFADRGCHVSMTASLEEQGAEIKLLTHEGPGFSTWQSRDLTQKSPPARLALPRGWSPESAGRAQNQEQAPGAAGGLHRPWGRRGRAPHACRASADTLRSGDRAATINLGVGGQGRLPSSGGF